LPALSCPLLEDNKKKEKQNKNKKIQNVLLTSWEKKEKCSFIHTVSV